MNLFTRLRDLLPEPPLLIGDVIAHNADGTSLVQLITQVASGQVAPGLSTGATIRARGTQVAVGSRAFVRNGVVESQAPSGAIVEIVAGAVAALPFGPARLSLGPALAPPAAALGVAYSFNTAPGFLGGYLPRNYVLTAGALPPGLTLNAVTGQISGTRSAAGAATGLVLRCTDSTHRAVESAPFGIA